MMLLFVRWVLLLAALHRCSGAVILVVIIAALILERVRARWLEQHPPPWAP